MINTFLSFVPFLGVVTAAILVLWLVHWLLLGRRPDLGNERKLPRHLFMLGLSLLGLLACVLALPISESSRNQIISLIGIVISGAIAFSSTTIISNLMASLLMRITKPFRVGDFIRVGDHFGRVSERGLFDTEIQTETRELISLPNIYCINNPVVTTLSSGTIISATLSLGYDVHRTRIEELLIRAAENAGLQEAFVHILELGNFSVTYRISGFLTEPKRLISARSALYACVLDTLHAGGIEIMSPTYMNQRQLSPDTSVIPPSAVTPPPSEQKAAAESIAFDKAEKAEEIENEKQHLAQEIEALQAALKEMADDDKQATQDALAQKKERLAELENTTELDDAVNGKHDNGGTPPPSP